MNRKAVISAKQREDISSSHIYTQLIVYISGFVLIFLLHLFFQNVLSADLENKLTNERARLRIGEMLVLDLQQVESQFYKMATLTNPKSQARVQRQLHNRLNAVREMLHVLQNGGQVQRITRVNIESQESIQELIQYQPSEGGGYVLEAIDILPKLTEIEQEGRYLLSLLKQRDRLKSSTNEYVESISTIKSYLITLPQLFVRAKENANRLLLIGKKRQNQLEAKFKQQTFYYLLAQLTISVLIILTVIGISFRLLRGVQAKNREVHESNQQLRKLSRDLENQKFALDQHAIVSATDLSGQIIYANDKFCKISGYSRKELLGKDHSMVGAEEHDASYVNDMWSSIASGKVWQGEIKNTSSTDGDYWVAATVVPLLDTQGKPYQYIFIRTDITERKRAELELQNSEERFNLAMRAANDGLWDWDMLTNTAFLSPRWKSMLGYQDTELENSFSTWEELVEEKGRQSTLDLINKCINGEAEGFSIEFRMQHKDGHWVDVLSRAILLRDDSGNPIRMVGTHTDITLQKEYQQQLEQNAHYDSLTTLPNRVLLADRLNQAMKQAKRRELLLAVIYLDLDGFKEINDAYGHDVGDQLLLVLAGRLQKTVREEDSVGRLGGDEFVILLGDQNDTVHCTPQLDRILAATVQPVHISNLTLQVSASLGVTFYPQNDDITGDQLLRQADQAMYQAKLNGKNNYHFFDIEYDRSLRGRQESLDRIKEGFLNKEFELYYQPKVNMRSGEIIGAEALIRWNHPEQGVLAPNYFLPIIEDQPIAVDVGEWVINTALSQIDIWSGQGIDIPISVNVGAIQLQQPTFIDKLTELVNAHPAIKRGALELEILETSALEDIDHISQVMAACKKIGVSFALDDFGTGYSSLTYLKKLPAEVLKIDRSFVRDILDDPDDLSILEGVIGMASAFRRKIIAEGVETAAHGDLLLQFGCDIAQGFGIAKPMPEAEFPGWMENWKPYPSWQQQKQASRDNVPLLFTTIEHRAWIKKISHYAVHNEGQPSELKSTECRFGKWLSSEAADQYRTRAGFDDLVSLHDQVHDCGSQLCESVEHDNQKGVPEGHNQLLQLSDELIDAIKGLMAED